MTTQYLITLPIEHLSLSTSVPAGEPFPLHCTVLPWFTLPPECSFESFNSGIEEIARLPDIEDLQLISSEPALFGKDHTVPVHVLADSSELDFLHERLCLLLEKAGGVPMEPEWIGSGYRAHVSNNGTREFRPGRKHYPTHLMVLSRGENKCRKVIAIHPIPNSS